MTRQRQKKEAIRKWGRTGIRKTTGRNKIKILNDMKKYMKTKHKNVGGRRKK
jgi:hypothetical protein